MTESAVSRLPQLPSGTPADFGLTHESHESTLPAGSLLAGSGLGIALIVGLGSGIAILERSVAVVALVVAALDPVAGLAFAAVTLPQREPQPIGPIGVPVLLAFAIGLGVILRLPIDRPRLQSGRVGWLALGYLAITAVSVTPLFNDLPYGRAVSGISLFLALAAGGVLIGAGTVLLGNRDARPLIVLALGSVGLAALIAILAFMKGADLGRPLSGLVSQSSTDLRAYGPFYNSDYLGFAAAQAIVLGVGLALYERRFRFPVLCVVFVSSIALVASFARSGFLATAVGLVALAFMRNRRLGMIVLVVGGIAFLLAYESLLKARVGITYGAAPGSALGTLRQSDAGRSDAALAGVQLFLTAPLFGIGYGQFHFLSPHFVGSSGVTFPHNIFVGILAEQGVLGVLVFGALVLAIVIGMGRSGHPLAVPIGALGITYLIGSLFIDSVTTLQTSIVFWICLAVVLSRRRGDRGPASAGRSAGMTSG